jgi:hypothetical protein
MGAYLSNKSLITKLKEKRRTYFWRLIVLVFPYLYQLLVVLFTEIHTTAILIEDCFVRRFIVRMFHISTHLTNTKLDFLVKCKLSGDFLLFSV